MVRIRIAILLAAFLAFLPLHSLAQTGGSNQAYPAGWNLIAAPPGTDVSRASGLFTLRSGDSGYRMILPPETTVLGAGYWAYLPLPVITTMAGDRVFTAPSLSDTVMVHLAPGSAQPITVLASPGQPVMVGNPSGSVPANVSGVSAAYAYNPTTRGYQLTTTLAPGQGAWALADARGLITITPNPRLAQSTPAAGPSPTPASRPGTVPPPPPPPPPTPPGMVATPAPGLVTAPSPGPLVTPPPATGAVTGTATGPSTVQAPQTAAVPSQAAAATAPAASLPRLPNTGTGGLLSVTEAVAPPASTFTIR